MSIVVSDTSPLRALTFLDRMDLLPKLYGRVIVPPAVAQELREPAGQFASIDLDDFRFVEIISPSSIQEVRELCQMLDQGESEALALAKELHADRILIDELAGRDVARQMGLALIGTLGVLVHGKNSGLVDSVRVEMSRLIDELGFFVSRDLFEKILEMAGEASPDD